MQVTDAMVAKALDAFTSDKWSSGMDAMRAALTAALAEMWRPIEEAKKNGDEYLCLIPGVGMGQMVLYWSDGYWREKANGLGLKIEPTHFMPLPAPPIGK